MFRFIADLFRTPSLPQAPFVDPILGEFTFDSDLGWKRTVVIDNSDVEIVLGSDGEPPDAAMLQTARSWVQTWPTQKSRMIDYARGEILNWVIEPNPPSADDLIIQSINILWPDDPETCMIYFQNPGDDIRLFHLTLNGLEPGGFAYDY